MKFAIIHGYGVGAIKAIVQIVTLQCGPTGCNAVLTVVLLFVTHVQTIVFHDVGGVNRHKILPCQKQLKLALNPNGALPVASTRSKHMSKMHEQRFEQLNPEAYQDKRKEDIRQG